MRSRISRGAPVGELMLGVFGLLVIGPLMLRHGGTSSCGVDEGGCTRDRYLIGSIAVGFLSGACLFLAWVVWPFARNKRPLPCELAARILPMVMMSAAVMLAHAFVVSLFHQWWSTLYALAAVAVAVADFVLHGVLEDASVHPDYR